MPSRQSAVAMSTKRKRKKRKRKTPPVSLARIINVVPLSQRIQDSAVSTMSSAKSESGSRCNESVVMSRNKRSKTRNISDKHSSFETTADSLLLIGRFHTLNKRLEQNKRDSTKSEEERKRVASLILKEMDDLGGIQRYQEASMYGAKSGKFVCAKWVEPVMRKHLFNVHKSQRRVKILDVGAIDNQYIEYTWFDVVAIDLNAQHPSVRSIDFFDFAQEKMSQEKSAPFDAIVQSLVLNFQGDPRRRGDMLALAADPRMLATNGLLFVALPSASLENSRYCSVDHFIYIAEVLGLSLLDIKHSEKLVLMTFRADRRHHCAREPVYDVATKSFKYATEVARKIVNPGRTRNNFAIMLKST